MSSAVQQRLMVFLYVAVIALLPFGRLAELPIVCLALWGAVLLFKHFRYLLQQSWFKVFSLAFTGYILLTLISAVDSYWPEKSWLVGLASLRFYLLGIVLLFQAESRRLVEKISQWLVLLVMVWVIDALIQALLGFNLLGMTSYPGRLTGVFGQNVKLGPVLALFLPVVMIYMCQHKAWLRWLVVGLMLAVILLSGTRSAWLMSGFVLLMFWWHHVKGRRWLLFLKTASLAVLGVTALWFVSDDFQQRVERSIQLLDGGAGAVDFALADRLPIWQTAVNMYQSHPFNGVGARAFRVAYAEFASEGDVWIAQQGSGLHAHHWVLELLAETGTIGLILMLWVLVLLIKHSKHVFQNDDVWPYGVALMAAFLPVVSLYSLFSSFWSICLWWLLIMLMSGIKNAQS